MTPEQYWHGWAVRLVLVAIIGGPLFLIGVRVCLVNPILRAIDRARAEIVRSK